MVNIDYFLWMSRKRLSCNGLILMVTICFSSDQCQPAGAPSRKTSAGTVQKPFFQILIAGIQLSEMAVIEKR